MSRPVRMGVSAFRVVSATGLLCGRICVRAGSPRRRSKGGKVRGQAKTPSLAVPSGSFDQAGEASAAGSAHTSDARSTDRQSTGEPGGGNGDAPLPAPEKAAKTKRGDRFPRTAAEFVRQVNEEQPLVPIFVGLLRSDDERIRERVALNLLEKAYLEEKRTSPENRSGRIRWSIPRPEGE